MKKISRKIGNELEDFVGAISDPSKADKTEVQAIVNVYGSKNLVFKTISQATIDTTGTIINDFSYALAVAKVKNGQEYIASKGFDYKVLAFYTSEPALNSVSYDGSRIAEDLVSVDSFSFISPIDGYAVFRVNIAFIYPMIRDARITDHTYTPYAMTNRELTEEITSIEPTVGKSIKATNSAWAGTTLTFSNITAVNNVMYRFTALRNDGGYCEYILINRADGIKSGKIAGNVDCTFTINGTTLTVTFASTGYWCYQLVKLNNYN